MGCWKGESMEKKSRFIKMSIQQLDEEIDKLPYNWMKAIMYTQIKESRPDYIPKHRREKKKGE